MANLGPHSSADFPHLAAAAGPDGGGPDLPSPLPTTSLEALEAVVPGPSFRSIPPMRYPVLYLWFVVVSSLDIMLTWLVLEQHGGYEVNPVAASVIEHWGLPGAIAFKYSLMLFVIIICEVIGRQRDRTARRLARWSLGVSAFPPIYTIVLVTLHLLNGAASTVAG